MIQATSSSSSPFSPPPSLDIHSLSSQNSTLSSTTVVPFKALSPTRKSWSIQGRVLSKTPLREFSNARGTGKSLGFDLIDRDSDQIHLSAFNELAESLHALIKIGHIYNVANGTIKIPNLSYNISNFHSKSSSSLHQQCHKSSLMTLQFLPIPINLCL